MKTARSWHQDKEKQSDLTYFMCILCTYNNILRPTVSIGDVNMDIVSHLIVNIKCSDLKTYLLMRW